MPSGAPAGTGGPTKAEVVHQRLELEINLRQHVLKGHARLWVVLPRTRPDDPEFNKLRLHARQMSIDNVRFNGKDVRFEYPFDFDLLKGNPTARLLKDVGPGVVPSDRMDGEALDLHYRCQLVASKEGELVIFIPPELIPPMVTPPAPKEVNIDDVGAIADPLSLVGAGGGDAVSMDGLPVLPPLTLTMHEDGQQTLDQPSAAGPAEPPSETTEAHLSEPHEPAPKSVEELPSDYRVCEVEVGYILKNPTAGFRFISDPPHAYSMRCPAALNDVDGARCWFPCLDRNTARACTFELYVTVTDDPEATVIASGTLVDTEIVAQGTRHKFEVDTPLDPCSLGLVVGRFSRHVDPQATSIIHHFLPPPSTPATKAWVAHTTQGLAAAQAFVIEFFNLPPQAPPPPQSTAFVLGSFGEVVMPFEGLTVHRAAALHPPRVFDESLGVHLDLVEGIVASWLLPRVRPRTQRDHWIFHGIVGYLLLLYVRRRYGEDEYRYRLLRLRDAVITLEKNRYSWPLHPLEDNALLASETYDPRVISLLRHKAPLILHMLEQRVGRKPLRVDLRGLACPHLAERGTQEEGGGDAMDVAGEEKSGGAKATANPPIGTIAFLRLCLKVSTRNESVQQLRDNWIEGRGVAFFKATYTFDKKKPKPVTIQLRQVVPQGSRLFTGSIRVRIMEEGGPYEVDREITEEMHEWTFKTHSKLKKPPAGRRKSAALNGGPVDGNDEGIEGMRPKKRKKKAKAGEAPDGAPGPAAGGLAEPVDAPDRVQSQSPGMMDGGAAQEEKKQDEVDDEYTAARTEQLSPVLWVQIDPDMQWICEIDWTLDEYMLIEQLHHDPDAAGQTLALRTLAMYPRSALGPYDPAVNQLPTLAHRALSDCIRCRTRPGWVEVSLPVRLEAIRALAAWQNNHAPMSMLTEEDGWRGLAFLFRCYKERFYDAAGRVPLPADFTNEAEYQVHKALLWAMSLVRARDGGTPVIVWDFIRKVLQTHDNTLNLFDDCAFLATALLSLCNLRMAPDQAASTPQVVADEMEQVKRYLYWYRERGSSGNAVPAAALRAAASLSRVLGGPKPTLDLKKFTSREFSESERLAAIEGLVRLEVAKDFVQGRGAQRSVDWVLDQIEEDGIPGSVSFKYNALKIMLEILRRPEWPRLLPFDPSLAETRLGDHLSYDLEGAYEPFDPFGTVLPPPMSTCNPVLIAMRSPSIEDLSVRGKVWRLVNEETWYSQPLRLMAIWLHQYIWGYSKPGEPLVKPKPAGPLKKTENQSQPKREFKALTDVFLELLALRGRGIFTLRCSFLDEKDWRIAHQERMLVVRKKGKQRTDENLSDEERQERTRCRERREQIKNIPFKSLKVTFKDDKEAPVSAEGTSGVDGAASPRDSVAQE